MRDLVFIRARTKALLKQLFPTGRAWQYPDDSDSAREQAVKSESIGDFLYGVENFVSKILPDNDLFNEQAAIDWERRLDLDYNPDTLTLEERRAEITRKLSYPGGFKYTLTLEFIEYQLRASLFDVRVYRGIGSQPPGTELIANSIDKEEGYVISNFFHTFIIAGPDINTQAIIKTERRQEFIRKILKYKPMNMVCFLNSTISKQDGTFKLKYDTYTCERIEETPPYATNVTISGVLEVGQILTGSYIYNDDQGDPESGTILQWYRADDALGTNKVAISGANSNTYLLVTADGNKYISFGVTPANAKSFGDEILSAYQLIQAEIKPEITSFVDGDTNRLTWIMSDGTQSVGTWQVEYSLNNGSTWVQSVAGGSPRADVLPLGVYNKNVYFRVKRISTPVTDYSNVFIQYVGEITDFNQNYTSPTQVVDESYLEPEGICTTGNQYTSGNIYFNGPVSPAIGIQLYYKAYDGIIYKATKQNLIDNPGPSPLNTGLGIKWVRFVPASPDYTWDVDPTTGVLVNLTIQYSCLLQ